MEIIKKPKKLIIQFLTKIIKIWKLDTVYQKILFIVINVFKVIKCLDQQQNLRILSRITKKLLILTRTISVMLVYLQRKRKN